MSRIEKYEKPRPDFPSLSQTPCDPSSKKRHTETKHLLNWTGHRRSVLCAVVSKIGVAFDGDILLDNVRRYSNPEA